MANNSVVAEGYHSHRVVWLACARMAPRLSGSDCNRNPSIGGSQTCRAGWMRWPRWVNATQLMSTGEERTAMWPTTCLQGARVGRARDVPGVDDQLAGSVQQLLLLLVKGGDGRLDQQCSRPVIIARRVAKGRCCAREETMVTLRPRRFGGCWVVPGGRNSGRG